MVNIVSRNLGFASSKGKVLSISTLTLAGVPLKRRVFLCSGYVLCHTNDHSRLAYFVISRITSTTLHVIRSHCHP